MNFIYCYNEIMQANEQSSVNVFNESDFNRNRKTNLKTIADCSTFICTHACFFARYQIKSFDRNDACSTSCTIYMEQNI